MHTYTLMGVPFGDTSLTSYRRTASLHFLHSRQALFDASESLFVRRSALVSALNMGHADAVKLLIAALDQEETMLRAAGIANSHLLEGPDVTRKLISAMETTDRDTQVLLV